MICPCCKTPLDPKEHPGLTINRRAYLRSQLITLREQDAKVRPLAASMRKGSDQARQLLASLEATIAAYEAELVYLG